MSIMHYIKSISLITLLAILSGLFLFDNHTSAIPLRTYAANDIYFYKPCAKTKMVSRGSSASLGSGTAAREKIWNALVSQPEITKEIAAGIIGNIAHEGGASPARFEGCYEGKSCPVGVGLTPGSTASNFDYENDPGRCMIGSTETGCGVGLIQWSETRRINLFKYVREKNSTLVDKYLKHPEKYGGYQGDNFIKNAESEADANELFAIEVEFLVKEIRENSYYKGLLDTKTVEEAAEFFALRIEECEHCKKGDAEVDKRINSAKQAYEDYKNTTATSNTISTGDYVCVCGDGSESSSSSGSSSSGTFSGGIYHGHQYKDLTDGQIRGLLAMISGENDGSEDQVKMQASIMANLLESSYREDHGQQLGEPISAAGLVHYVTRKPHSSEKGWFYTYNLYNESYSGYPQNYFDAVADVLRNGNRTLPPQILEHDGYGDYNIYIDNQQVSDSDANNYIKGKTEIRNNNGASFIFYQFANPSGTVVSSDGYGNHTGDPFGYFSNYPPPESSNASSSNSSSSSSSSNSSTDSTTSSVTWTKKGWIDTGLDGYTKEDGSKIKKLSKTASKDFTTDMPNAKDKGPTTITITVTEGPGASSTGGLELFKSNKTSKPPHFTIDLFNKKIYQHFPIYKTSGANTSTDDGLYIAIIGYSDTEKAKKDKNEKWDLTSLTESDYQYLNELLSAIADATGIDTSSLTAPDFITEALEQPEATNTNTTAGTSGNPCGDGDSSSSYGGGTPVNGHCFSIPAEDGGCTQDGFTWFAQSAASWGGDPYGWHGTIGEGGCGPAALAMIITALTGQLHTPKEVAPKAAAHGARADNGSYGDKLAETAEIEYGLKTQHIDDSQVTEENVNKWLSEGKMMIFSVGPYQTEYGPLTGGGHFIAIRKRAEDGKWLTFDSSHKYDGRNDRHYKPDDILQAYLTHGKENFYLVYK